MDATTRKLLEQIQRDILSCAVLSQPAHRPVQQTTQSTEHVDSPAPAVASPRAPTAATPRLEPTTPQPKPKPEPAPALARKRYAKRSTPTVDDKPLRTKKPRKRREAPEAPVEERVPVDGNGASSAMSEHVGADAHDATSSRADYFFVVKNHLVIADHETEGVLEVLKGVVESQRERQRYAAKLAGLY